MDIAQLQKKRSTGLKGKKNWKPYPVMNPPSLENYLLITGENGCGKTSLVQEAIQKNKSGVIYIDSKNFDADMATALDYKPINGLFSFPFLSFSFHFLSFSFFTKKKKGRVS